MNAINWIDLAKFNTSKMDGTPNPQTNVPVKKFVTLRFEWLEWAHFANACFA